MDQIRFLTNYLDQHSKDFVEMSDTIWGYAEHRFQEYRSAALQQEYLREKGFRIRANLAGEETAFIAEYGEGKPIIAFCGEYDALAGLSQQAGVPRREPLPDQPYGHGCGHNLLGTGCLAAAEALRACMEEEGLAGTIRYYGCPAEENAGGKAFLVRDGLFDDCDIALYWHPFAYNQVVYGSSNANFRVFFTFHGTAAHAASAPHLGRSALDAVELMNVGVNYMREHMIDEARVHYAVTDTGGDAPNVVQRQAQVLYAIRAPELGQVRHLYERIVKIAQGAALMTETTVEIKQVASYANVISNTVICRQIEKYFAELPPVSYTQEELDFAQQFKRTLLEEDREGLENGAKAFFGRELARQQLAQPIYTAMAENNKHLAMKGSADLGDVSWKVPAAYFYGASWAAGTPPHSWQAAAQGKSSIAHKGMLHAAGILACVGYDFLTNPELVRQAKEELLKTLDGEEYVCPLPPECKPEVW